ncbi:MAG: hypothetical protein KatS3mg014_2575 [Actinomycetota bacterium]|nr:MAG: hypothetical protein KatS3mg014_2575 [Actinomycetota bacterium]
MFVQVGDETEGEVELGRGHARGREVLGVHHRPDPLLPRCLERALGQAGEHRDVLPDLGTGVTDTDAQGRGAVGGEGSRHLHDRETETLGRVRREVLREERVPRGAEGEQLRPRRLGDAPQQGREAPAEHPLRLLVQPRCGLLQVHDVDEADADRRPGLVELPHPLVERLIRRQAAREVGAGHRARGGPLEPSPLLEGDEERLLLGRGPGGEERRDRALVALGHDRRGAGAHDLQGHALAAGVTDDDEGGLLAPQLAGEGDGACAWASARDHHHVRALDVGRLDADRAAEGGAQPLERRLREPQRRDAVRAGVGRLRAASLRRRDGLLRRGFGLERSFDRGHPFRPVGRGGPW